jgi:hypothetical protein
MWRRCTQVDRHNWANYGGAGIAVCDRWRDFRAFLADMGERPEGMTLDRIDSTRDYDPTNCRWADQATQSANRRSPRKAG